MYLVSNTPIGESGITPRDLDHGWSALSPLERDLLPFYVGEITPASEWAAELFGRWQDLYGVARRYLHARGEDMKKRENAYRYPRTYEIGDKVARKERRHPGAAHPKDHRPNFVGPYIVDRAGPYKVTLRELDGNPAYRGKEIPTDELVPFPDWHVGTIQLKEDSGLFPSPGQLAERAPMHDAAVRAADTRGYNRIVQNLVPGSKILYARPKTVGVPGAKPPGLHFASAEPSLGGEAADQGPIVLSGPPHKVRGRVSGEVAGVGEVINVDRSKTPAILEIHRYIGVWKGVGVQWYPSYRQNDGRETTAVTGKRYVELVAANKLIDHGRLNTAGNLIHGLVAKLSARKWEVDCVSPSPQESFPVNVAQHLYYREGLEQLMKKIAAIDGVLDLGFHYSVLYAEDVFVDYLEVFTGKGRLRAEVIRRGHTAGPLIDKNSFIGEPDYELKTVPLGTKEWHLETHNGGVALIELLYASRPKVTYVAWPCGNWSMQRERTCDPLTEDNDLALWEENVALLRLSA